jgi:predicted acetyltransferase
MKTSAHQVTRHDAHLHLELIAAAFEQAPILANLLELYVHDFSEFLPLDVGDDGRFNYPSLPLYWSEPNRHPFLIKVDGKLAGLVLVMKGPGLSGNDQVWDMAEFFILRGYRRRGVGAQAAREVWSLFPGRWQVRAMQANAAAQSFWASAIATFIGKPIPSAQIEDDGKQWNLFSFESPGH